MCVCVCVHCIAGNFYIFHMKSQMFTMSMIIMFKNISTTNNCTYSPQQVEHLFSSELCAEEQGGGADEGGVVSEGEEGVVKGSPAPHRLRNHEKQKGDSKYHTMCSLYF